MLYVALVYFLMCLFILFLKPMNLRVVFGWPLILVMFLYAWGSQYLGYEVRK